MLSRLSPRHWPLWLQLGAPITIVVILSIGLVAFLNDFNFQKSYRQLTQDKYWVLGKDARQVVESGLNVGLQPAVNQGLRQFLDQLRQTAPGLRFMAVLDQHGAVSVNSGALPAGGTWRRAPLDKNWHGQDQAWFYLGLPFKNSFGVTIGTLVLGYERAGVDAAIAQMHAKLLRVWLLVSLAVALITPYAVWLLTRQLSTELAQAAAAIDQTFDATLPELPPLAALGDELAEGIPQFIASSRDAVRQLQPSQAEAQA